MGKYTTSEEGQEPGNNVGHVPIEDRFAHDERMLAYKWTGEGYTIREIVKMLKKRRWDGQMSFNRFITVEAVTTLLSKPEAQKPISQFRLSFLKELSKIPASEKKMRLWNLEHIRGRLELMINNSSPTKSDKEFNRFMICSRQMLLVLDLARAEVEPKAGVLPGGLVEEDGELSNLSYEQLKAQRDELLRKAQRAIEQRTATAGEDPEGDAKPGEEKSPGVLLASPTELRREPLPGGTP